jgi:hypothetical protein
MNVCDKSVDELQLTVRTFNCLKNAQIHTVRELVYKIEAELLRSRTFGRKSLNELREVLAEFGLHFGMRGDADAATSVRNTNNPRQPSCADRLWPEDDWRTTLEPWTANRTMQASHGGWLDVRVTTMKTNQR